MTSDNLPAIEGEVVEEPHGHTPHEYIDPLRFGKGTGKLQDAIWVYERRLVGEGWLNLSRITGVSVRKLQTLVNWYLDKYVVPQGEHIRAMEEARLDYLLERLMPLIDRGHPLSIQTAVRISESRRKMYRADLADRTAPKDAEEEHEMTTEVKSMIEAARARMQQHSGQASDSINMLP